MLLRTYVKPFSPPEVEVLLQCREVGSLSPGPQVVGLQGSSSLVKGACYVVKILFRVGYWAFGFRATDCPGRSKVRVQDLGVSQN